MVKILLTTSDNQEIEVESEAISMSRVIKTMLNDVGVTTDEEVIPIPIKKVNYDTMRKVLEYCDHHKDDAAHATISSNNSEGRVIDDISAWDNKYMKVDQDTLFKLILAANYLGISGLLDLGCKIVAGMIKGKNPEQIRRTFGINKDFTPEEEAKIRGEDAFNDDAMQ